jgi:hypothetical protein
MTNEVYTNELYLAVMPIIHLGSTFGLTEQALTLFPSRDFATVFFSDEVDAYVTTFKNRANEYLTGGHVTHYDVQKQQVREGFWIVKVIQYAR